MFAWFRRRATQEPTYPRYDRLIEEMTKPGGMLRPPDPHDTENYPRHWNEFYYMNRDGRIVWYAPPPPVFEVPDEWIRRK